MKSLRNSTFSPVLSTLFLLALTADMNRSAASDWPQFLGPQRSGVSAETGLIDSFPAGGPKELWQVDAVGGMSGVAVADGAAYTMIQDGDQQSVLSVAAATGETRWQAPVGAAYGNSMGDGPRATPTVVGQTVVSFTGDGILTALSTKDGSVLWRHNAVEELGGKVADYGMACSPLVTNGVAIVGLGAPGATLVAYELKSGERKWTAGTKDAAGYSSPALVEIDGSVQIAAFTGNALIGVDPMSGSPLWRYPYETDYHCNTATPIGLAGGVLISAGENHGSVLLSIGKDGAVREKWTALGPKSEFRSEWQTPVLVDGYLYAFDNVGSASSVTHLTCIEAATGKPVWQQRRFGKGNLIAADGKLWITTMKGELVLVKATPDGFRELSRATVIGETRQAPALASGRLYLRDGQQIVCFDVHSEAK